MSILWIQDQTLCEKTHPVIIVLQEICTHNLVSCEEILRRNRRHQEIRYKLLFWRYWKQEENVAVYLERGKCIWGNVKGWELHVAEEAVELLREEHRPGQRLVTQALSQHHSTVQSYFCTLISAQVNTCRVKSFIASYITNTADVTQSKIANNQNTSNESTNKCVFAPMTLDL